MRIHDIETFTAVASLSPFVIVILAYGASAQPSSVSDIFSVCGSGQRITCVVDGDTFGFRGEKIRIAGIDTPELSPPRCERERERGLAAKQRLLDILNSGPLSFKTTARDEDRFGQSSGSSTASDDRSAIFSSPKAWLGSGKDHAGVGANETDARISVVNR